ncbi:hypothetical protein B0H67DRAFT_380681 [Lasiosphaeris hirsuta]|uniref:Kinesin light chain n=1 Tax=Lasiosphaeris hirsuta TaxID=260670 RepID=A0AA40DLM2_9PEZI|nr:hypothetical protein B0H67DRAFT_380681 [Lasiosphaeris hirsuta]
MASTIGLFKQTNISLLRVLQADSELLSRIHEAFLALVERRKSDSLLPPIEVVCFFEALPAQLIGTVVPKSSARMEGHDPISIHDEHRGMTKFRDTEDPGFKSIIGEIKRLVHCISTWSATKPPRPLGAVVPASENRITHLKPVKGPFIVPFPRNEIFIGRADVIQDLVSLLHHPPDLSMPSESHRRAALCGLGGIGETNIATEYAWSLRNQMPEMAIFWVHASSATRFTQAYTEIARECEIPGYANSGSDVQQLVTAWLIKHPKPWLLIVDNADDSGVFFESPNAQPEIAPQASGQFDLCEYIPRPPNGSVLITSRNKQVAIDLLGGESSGLAEIVGFNLKKAIKFVQGQLGLDEAEDDVVDLIGQLDRLPLALSQATSYIKKRQINIAKYLHFVRQGDDGLVRLLSEPFQDFGRDSRVPNAVATTWILSFDQIKEQHPLAGDIICFMSCVDREEIPQAFLSTCLWPPDWTQGMRIMDDMKENPEYDEIALEEAFGILKAFSLVTESRESGNFTLNRLVHLVALKWVQSQGRYSHFAINTLFALRKHFPVVPKYPNWGVCREFLPHFDAALTHQAHFTRSPKVDDLKASLLYHVSVYLLDRNDYTRSELLLCEATAIFKETRAPTDWDVLWCRISLANVYYGLNRYDEAETHFSSVRGLFSEEYGPTNQGTLACLRGLAGIYRRRGELGKAEKIISQALEARTQTLGSDHVSTLFYTEELAMTYLDQGRLTEAEALMRRALEGQMAKQGETHPDTLRVMHNLTCVFASQERDDEAWELMAQCLELQREVLGGGHANTKISQSRSNRWAEARERGVRIRDMERDINDCAAAAERRLLKVSSGRGKGVDTGVGGGNSKVEGVDRGVKGVPWRMRGVEEEAESIRG